MLHVAEVSFTDVQVGEPTGAPSTPSKARHLALTGMAITIVGACQRVLDLVLEHVRGRQQFGVPIGSFQAVKHKAVDMYVAIERARALGYFAALTIAEDDAPAVAAASMAKAAAGDGQRIVFRHGIQLFGGHRVHVGERPAALRSGGPRPASCCSAAPPSTGSRP